MKELVEYTMNNLYGLVKPYGKYEAEELCYIVEQDYDCINEISYITDDLNKALAEAKETNSKIFIFENRLPDRLPDRLLGTLRFD